MNRLFIRDDSGCELEIVPPTDILSRPLRYYDIHLKLGAPDESRDLAIASMINALHAAGFSVAVEVKDPYGVDLTHD